MKIRTCPECDGDLERGFANAVYAGSLWTRDATFDFARPDSARHVSKADLIETLGKKESQDKVAAIPNPQAVRCLSCGFIALLPER